MESLVIQSKSKSNIRLLSALSYNLGDKVIDNRGKDDLAEIYLASESAFAKDWLSEEEDKAWKDL